MREAMTRVVLPVRAAIGGPWLLQGLLIGGLYLLAGQLGVALRINGVNISAIWPPNALLLTALLLLPPRRWWFAIGAASLAHVLLQLQLGTPAWRVATQLVSNTLLVSLTATLLNTLFGARHSFATLRGALGYLLVAVLCPLLAMLLPATVAWARGAESDFALAWVQMALSNIMAFVALVPAALLTARHGPAWLHKAEGPRVVEAAALAGSLILVCLLVFARPVAPDSGQFHPHVSFYLPLPLLLWAAMRFGPGGASLAIATTTLISIGAAARGLGPFSAAPLPGSVLDQQLFLLAFSTPTLCVAALMHERQAAVDALARANGELEQRIAARTADLLQANASLERRVRQLSALNRITEVLAGPTPLSAALEQVAAATGALFQTGQVLFWLREAVGGPLRAYGPAGSADPPIPAGALRRRVIGRGEALLLQPGERPADMGGAPLAGGMLVLPLSVQSRTAGMMAIGPAATGRAYAADDLALAQTIAAAVAVAVESARLAEQAREEIVSQERRRLARELHDSVSQALYAANSVAEVLPLTYAGDAAAGRQALFELQSLVRIAQAEMRTLLYELRPTALTTAPLSNLLQALAASVDGRLEAVLLTTIAPAPLLPPEVQLAVYRIAQEALQNSVKHAQAHAVRLELALDPPFDPQHSAPWRGCLTLTICDDGRGFEPTTRAARGHGLDSIAERAQLIDARCSISSAPGAGTRVTLCWTGAAS